jgi:hypothetical protein
LSAASGAKPTSLAPLASDVLTLVKKTDETGATVFVPTLRGFWPGHVPAGVEGPGSASSPSSPTTANFTVTRYHVDFVPPMDATPGVDVPFPFDGGMTVTVGGSRRRRVLIVRSRRTGSASGARRIGAADGSRPWPR